MAKVGICSDCGQKDFLQIHHIDRNHSNNAPDNLRRLCKYCHGLEHGQEGAEAYSHTFDLTDEIRPHRLGFRLLDSTYTY